MQKGNISNVKKITNNPKKKMKYHSHRNDTYADCDQLPRPGVFRFFPENGVLRTKPSQ